MTFLDISRFDVAEQYIQASRNLIDGMLETGNRLVAMSDHRLSEKELYEELRSNSQSIILPALFCLYQGVELLLKGFVIMKTQKNSGHNAEALFGDFATCYPEEGDLRALFKKFIYSPKDFISQYKQENGIKSNISFYNSLRYPDKRPQKDPDDRDNDACNYISLMIPDNKKFLPQLEELKTEIEQLLRLSVKLYRDIKDTEIK